MFKLGICLRTENDFRAGYAGKFYVSADKIGVQMRFYNIFYSLIVGFGFRNVLLDIALRVNNRRLAFRTDVIRSVRQTACLLYTSDAADE